MLPKDAHSELLAKVAAGDENAFREIFETYWDAVYGVAFTLTKSASLAEEMVQEVFLDIWLKREKLAAVEKFSSYLFIVARNHIFNVLRKKIREEAFTEHLLNYFRETGDSPAEQLETRETEELFCQAIEKLPPQQRLIFGLCRKQGLSHEEIALRLQISRHTVKSHMHKALQFIQHYLLSHAEM